MASSSSGLIAEISSGSGVTNQPDGGSGLHVRSPRLFPWDGRSALYESEIGIESTAPSSHADCAPWGNPGQADRISFTLAEWLCRAADRIDPARVFGPPSLSWARPHLRRISAIVCLLLQRDQNSPVIGQGCADLSPGFQQTGVINSRAHPWRTPSPLRPSFRFSVHTRGPSSKRPGRRGAARPSTAKAGRDIGGQPS